MGRIAKLGLSTAGMAIAILLTPPVSVAGNDAPLVVAPGDEIGIACDALQYSAPESDVRVVLTISALPSAVDPGMGKVLATNEELTPGAVHVRIPEVPELSNRTVSLDVYVVTATGSHNCAAGQVQIAGGHPPAAPGHGG